MFLNLFHVLYKFCIFCYYYKKDNYVPRNQSNIHKLCIGQSHHTCRTY